MKENEKITTEEITEDAPLNGRAKVVEYLRAENPDSEIDYEDDDAFFGALDASMLGKDESIKRYKENSKTLSDVMNNNPEVGAFIADIVGGMDTLEAISSNFGDIFSDDEEIKASYKKGLENHKNRFAEQEKIKELQKANVEKFQAEVEEFIQGLPEEEREGFAQFVGDTADKIYMFDFSNDLLNRMLKAYKYDQDVQEAQETGEVIGRNENIELKKKDVSDGVPNISSARNTPKENKRAFSFKKESIWDKD